MTKYELIGYRRALYELAGSIGGQAEINENNLFNQAYDHLSNAIDSLEEHGYNMGWIDRLTNEVIENEK